MTDEAKLWKERQDCDACAQADRVVADAVKRFASDRSLFYLLQWIAGGKVASQVYRDRLHERFVEVCNGVSS
jgi:hypothetical protein